AKRLTHSPIQCQFNSKAIILLGASTGGTEALSELLSGLPAEMPGICVVQHIPPVFSTAFANRLNTQCALKVKEACDNDLVTPGLVLVAPGDYHMMLTRYGNAYRVQLKQGAPVWHQRPAVDLLFQSAAQIVGSNAIGALLTGMGKDGAAGLLELRNAGSATIAQDEDTCVVYGMPKAAIEIGAAQRILPLPQIGPSLIEWSKHYNNSYAPVSTAPQLHNL
ncbi:MAG TPA: CheB methylesterase domain-containing protein, partial [Opitutales bacterium]|nr:CheB methylesterase domain-containing protein [Opitutales bacterium]